LIPGGHNYAEMEKEKKRRGGRVPPLNLLVPKSYYVNGLFDGCVDVKHRDSYGIIKTAERTRAKMISRIWR
jgi:hypothetical protein